MNQTSTDSESAFTALNELEYESMRLSRLTALVVFEADRSALNEIHERRLVCFRDKGPMRLIEFISCLRDNASRHGIEIAEQAYDRTIDRFGWLRSQVDEAGWTAFSEGAATPGDCRTCFGAYLSHLDRMGSYLDSVSELERESIEIRAMQTLVRRHFNFAFAEAKRNGSRTRYEWKLPGGALRVMMPRSVSGRERQRWLINHVGPADPRAPGERDRVQRIIDDHFGSALPMAVREDDVPDPSCALTPVPPIPGEDLMEISSEGLANTVATEKAANIGEQRPAIQALGARRLREMILKIFRLLDENQYRAAEIAEDFGVSATALSHFAGTRWARLEDAESGDIPALWLNTAKVLGSDPDFREAAGLAGVWRRVEAINQNHSGLDRSRLRNR